MMDSQLLFSASYQLQSKVENIYLIINKLLLINLHLAMLYLVMVHLVNLVSVCVYCSTSKTKLDAENKPNLSSIKILKIWSRRLWNWGSKMRSSKGDCLPQKMTDICSTIDELLICPFVGEYPNICKYLNFMTKLLPLNLNNQYNIQCFI